MTCGTLQEAVVGKRNGKSIVLVKAMDMPSNDEAKSLAGAKEARQISPVSLLDGGSFR